MPIQARHLGSRLLLILALVAALLTGIVAIQWATSHSNLTYAFDSTTGGDTGGGHTRWREFQAVTAAVATFAILELSVPLALRVATVAARH